MNAEVYTSPESPVVVFERFFEKPVVKISWEELPVVVQEYFEVRSKLRVYPDDWKPRNYLSLWRIDMGGNDTLYAGEQKKDTVFDGVLEGREHLIHCIRFQGDTRVADSTIEKLLVYKDQRTKEIIRNEDPFPFTDFIGVERDFQRKGLAHEQLRAMNALSHMIFNQPLHSSTYQTPSGEAMTKSAVEKGLAISSKKYPERFVYITTATGVDPATGD